MTKRIYYFKNLHGEHDINFPQTKQFWDGIARATEKLGWRKRPWFKKDKITINDFVPMSFLYDADVIVYDRKNEILIFQINLKNRIEAHKKTWKFNK